MRFFVIRHGITELNKKKIPNGQIDEPLAPEGIEQAKKAISLIPKSIKYIYVSPLLRTRQTAEIINSELNLAIIIAPNIREIHMGSLAGKSWSDNKFVSELKRIHRSIKFDYRKVGGEEAGEVKKRVKQFLKEIKTKHKDREVLLVTHGGILRVLHILETKKENLNDIENTSLHIFDIDKMTL